MKTILSVTNTTRYLVAASLLVLLLSFTPGAGAVVVKNLYDVEFPVPDQSRHVRSAVFKKGLEEVLIRVSGSRSILQNVTPGNAASYVQQFRYIEDAEEEKTAGVSQSTASKSASEWYI